MVIKLTGVSIKIEKGQYINDKNHLDFCTG